MVASIIRLRWLAATSARVSEWGPRGSAPFDVSRGRSTTCDTSQLSRIRFACTGSVSSIRSGLATRSPCTLPAFIMSRFREPQHPDFQRLNASLHFDRRLWPQDLAQSRAHARMLAARGILTEADRDELLLGLEAVEAELAEERFPFREDDEDIHMAIGRRLTELVGPVGGRLHTARSRNDQVATDVTMYTRERARDAQAAIAALMAALLARAEEH